MRWLWVAILTAVGMTWLVLACLWWRVEVAPHLEVWMRARQLRHWNESRPPEPPPWVNDAAAVSPHPRHQDIPPNRPDWRMSSHHPAARGRPTGMIQCRRLGDELVVAIDLGPDLPDPVIDELAAERWN